MQNYKPRLTRWHILILTLLILGIFFRCVNLERIIYDRDEAYTSLQIAGYTQAEFVQQVFTGQILNVEDLQRYQHLNPTRGLVDTIKALAVETPEHPPLYYLMLRVWTQWFGSSVIAIRNLSVLIGILVFPCIYWLCSELFKSSLVGEIAIALVAVSPFHICYAQQAREYSLWTVTILISSAALLRAMRQKEKLSWATYSITFVLGFYTHSFSMLVAIFHGIYVLAIEGFRFSKTFTAYLLASLVGLFAFAPWLFIFITSLPRTPTSPMAWLYEETPRSTVISALFWNLKQLFIIPFDFEYNSWLHICFLTLLGYAIFLFCRKAPKQIRLFILTMMGVTTLALLVPDLVLKRHVSIMSRYFIPCYLGIELAIAYLFANQIVSRITLKQKIWQTSLAILVSIGVISGVSSSVINFQSGLSFIKTPQFNSKLL